MENIRRQFPRESVLIAEVFPEFWAEISRLIDSTEHENQALQEEEAIQEEATVGKEGEESASEATVSNAGTRQTDEAGAEGGTDPKVPVEEEEIERFLSDLANDLATGELDWSVGELSIRIARCRTEEEENKLSPAEALRDPKSPYYKGPPPPPPRQKLPPPKDLEEEKERDRQIQARLDRLSALMALSRPDPNACWNCGSGEHKMIACPQPRTHRFCYGCGRTGYTLRDCPLCEDEYRIFGTKRLSHRRKE